MTDLPGIIFSGSPLDRADHLRGNAAMLAAASSKGAMVLRLEGLDPVLDEAGSLLWDPFPPSEDEAEVVFLGLLSGAARYVRVPAAGSVAPPAPGLWRAMTDLSPPEIAIYGAARALAGWHARHRFCAQCGAPTLPAKGGWQRNCVSQDCRAEHFPRTDPVTIMLVEQDGRLLLGRQPRFPPKRFSALAGFVEPGETIEEAVAREVFEEAGVRVRDVSYVASQPWPFPSSLMIGCHALADDPAITIDATELDDARWFSRDEVRAAMADDPDAAFIAPPATAIAHHLLRWWLHTG